MGASRRTNASLVYWTGCRDLVRSVAQVEDSELGALVQARQQTCQVSPGKSLRWATAVRASGLPAPFLLVWTARLILVFVLGRLADQAQLLPDLAPAAQFGLAGQQIPGRHTGLLARF